MALFLEKNPKNIFFLLCPRCILFPLFHFRWYASMLFLVFLFFFPLLVSILGLPLSCLHMVYVEHDQAISISFESTKSSCPWCLWCYAGLCWRFCSARISSLSFSDRCYGRWRVCWCLYQSFSSTLSHIGAQIVHSCYKKNGISARLQKLSFRIKNECRKKQVFTLITIYIMWTQVFMLF